MVDFRRDLDLEFSRSIMEFAISQPKMVRLPRNEKQTCRLNFRPHMWLSGLTLAMTLTLNFQGQIWNLLYLSQNGPIATKRKANISIELKASNMTIRFDLGYDLDLAFWRSNMEFAISQPKLVRLPRNEKQLYIDWTSNVTIRFDLGHDLDLEFSRSNLTLTFDHTHGLDHG